MEFSLQIFKQCSCEYSKCEALVVLRCCQQQHTTAVIMQYVRHNIEAQNGCCRHDVGSQTLYLLLQSKNSETESFSDSPLSFFGACGVDLVSKIFKLEDLSGNQ